ncbi:unnamed protein product [Colias eurytheme]|nr:unnamed protein product [Colias eurytheme]
MVQLRHFYSQHRAKYEEIHNANLAAKEIMPPQTSNATKSVMQCCTKFVTDHGRPFSLSEDKAFRDLIKEPGVTENQHQAINIKNVRSSIQDMAYEIRGKISNEIKNNQLAIKVDVASITLRRFLGLNIQYVMAKYLAKE